MKKRIVLASHGNLAVGMKNSLQVILGSEADSVTTFCLTRQNDIEDFKTSLLSSAKNNRDSTYFVFCDLYGASVFTSLYPLVLETNIIVFSGMNLALLIACISEVEDVSQLPQTISRAQQDIKVFSNIEMRDISLEEF